MTSDNGMQRSDEIIRQKLVSFYHRLYNIEQKVSVEDSQDLDRFLGVEKYDFRLEDSYGISKLEEAIEQKVDRLATLVSDCVLDIKIFEEETEDYKKKLEICQEGATAYEKKYDSAKKELFDLKKKYKALKRDSKKTQSELSKVRNAYNQLASGNAGDNPFGDGLE